MTSTEGRIATVLAAKLAAPADVSVEIADEAARRSRDVLHACIAEHGGREFGGGGNSFLAEFPTALRAIRCAVAIEERLRETATDRRGGTARIGVSLGEVKDDAGALYGDAVDTAKTLRSIAAAGDVVVSGAVQEQVHEQTEFAFHRVRPPSHDKLRVKAYRVTSSDAKRSGYDLIQELIRRRIFRAAGAYVIAAWLLVQVASIVFPEFDAPRWAMRTLIILLTVGFPFVVFVAWTVDVTGSGFTITPDSPYSRTRGKALQFGIVGIATAMSAAFLWWIWAGYIEPTTQRPTRAEIKQNPIIAVSIPSKLSGPEEIDWLGEGFANLIRNDLAESRNAIVLSQSRWQKIAAGASSRPELVNRASDAGIDYLVGGEYLSTPSGIVFTTWIEDLEGGTQIQGDNVTAPDAAGIIAATAKFAVQVKSALSIPHLDNVGQFTADFAVKNMAAYEAYVAGLGYLVNFDYKQAEESFQAALTLAPDYHMARFRLAEIMETSGRSELALKELDAIPEDAPFSERERLYIEGARWNFTANRDEKRSIEVYSELFEKYPYDIEAGQHLADAYWLDFREDESIDLYRKLAQIHSYDASSWMALGERLLDVGRLQEAEDALTRYVRISPDDAYAVALLGQLAQLQGDYSRSIDLYDDSLRLNPGFGVATLGKARSLYLDGDAGASESLFRQLVEDASQVTRFRRDAAFDLSGILRGQGRFDDAREPLESVDQLLRDEGLFMAMMDSTLGLIEIERGNTERAAALIARAIDESPGVPTRHLFARGVLELRTGRLDDVRSTAAEIRALALPPDDPDRTEDKAASYLLGLAALAEDDLEAAAAELNAAIALEGYEYAIYTVGLAELQYARGDLEAALETARVAMNARDPGNLRLDLELDRARATLLHAQILAAMGHVNDARTHATRFVERWRSASAESPDLVLAYELLGRTETTTN